MATDQEMMDRIAKLSSAIEQQRHMASNRGGYYARGRPFRGRGGNMSLSNTSTRHSTAPYYPVNTSNKKYINPAAVKPSTATAYVNPSIKANHYQHRSLAVNKPASPMSTPPLPPPLQSHNKKLIINHKGNNTTTSNTVVKSINTATGRKQVAIDGVDFVVKGKKLIRKDLFDSNMTKTNLIMANSTAPKVLVRKSIKSSKRRDKNKNMVIGKAPIVRCKPATRRHYSKGNMVFVRGPEGYVRQGRSGKSLVLNSHKRTIKKPRYCGFFTRYGKCPNGARCPFVHDTNRRAICPRFLQNRCKKTAAECRLSHAPNPHIMPHCVHFQKGHCINDPCMYAHVLVSKDAPVCRAFAMEGYCPKGLECDEKHVHVCPEFAETGKCSNANCRLPHVARRSKQDQSNSSKTQAAGIVRLGSWVSPQYYHAQKMAKAERRKAIEEATAAKVWTRPALIQEAKEQAREKEEQDGFVRLFDDSDDDDGWSQYERSSDAGVEEPLRFKDEADEDEDEEEGDEEEDDNSDEPVENQNHEAEDIQQDTQSEDSDQDDFFDAVDAESPVNEEDSDVEEVYEETSDTEMSDS
ncbi:hypothetical protein PS15m_001835 [Mucor circinelloides]